MTLKKHIIRNVRHFFLLKSVSVLFWFLRGPKTVQKGPHYIYFVISWYRSFGNFALGFSISLNYFWNVVDKICLLSLLNICLAFFMNIWTQLLVTIALKPQKFQSTICSIYPIWILNLDRNLELLIFNPYNTFGIETGSSIPTSDNLYRKNQNLSSEFTQWPRKI